MSKLIILLIYNAESGKTTRVECRRQVQFTKLCSLSQEERSVGQGVEPSYLSERVVEASKRRELSLQLSSHTK